MKNLFVDLETRSSCDIAKTGSYKYAQDKDFEILLFAYAYDDEEVAIIDLKSGEKIPEAIINDLKDPNVEKHAYNAAFEWWCLNQAGYETPLEQWRCTMIHGMYCGYTAGLGVTGEAIGLPQNKQKLTTGKALIRYFCTPRKPTKTDSRPWNNPNHAPEKWQLFKEYCIQDVVTEREIGKRLEAYPVPDSEWHLWHMDVAMNAYGVRTDRELVDGALKLIEASRESLEAEAKRITGLDNPNSVSQLISWLNGRGVDVSTLDKETVKELLKNELPADVRRVLMIRQRLGKTSIKKYSVMKIAAGEDDRVRGVSQFYGANRTGRYCLTGDHEVLTKDGWVRLDEWEGGYIAVYNHKSAQISFQKSEHVEFPYSGDMYEYSDTRLTQCSTPDHKMWAKKYRAADSFEVMTVEKMATGRACIPVTGGRFTSTHADNIWLRVLIMTQADGYYTADGEVKFHFRKQRKIERCKMLLRRAGIPYSIVQCSSGTTQINIPYRGVPLWLRQFQTKTFGTWLFDEDPSVIFDELEHWDGYRGAPNSIQFCTCNKTNADIIQALAHMSGRTAIIKKKNRTITEKNAHWSDAYVVNIWENPGPFCEIRKRPEVKHFDGIVHCAVTPTGYFLVRRDGVAWITGNSGKLLQLQNVTKNHMSDIDLARKVVKKADLTTAKILYDDVEDLLSQLVRTALIPSEGRHFVVADFSAIEARVIAWLAGETWAMEEFAGEGKIYEATAAQMFGVSKERIKKGNPEYELRQKGKCAVLGLGYGGGPNALVNIGALKMGIPEEDLQGLVDMWRNANPNIVKFWYDCDKAMHKVMETASPVTVGCVTFALEGDLKYGQCFLTAKLPSGRKLYYVKPHLRENRFGKQAVHYFQQGQITRKWEVTSTYHGRIVENLCQAVARDCLTEILLRIEKKGWQAVFHVHDEVIVDAPKDVTSDDLCELMAEPIPWAPGLVLRGAGFESDYYMKD